MHWYGHVTIREDYHILREGALQLRVKGKEGLKSRQMEEESVKADLCKEDVPS